MDSLTMTRQEQIAGLSSGDFASKLTDRFNVLNRITEVVKEAINEGEIEPWEYPAVELALGKFAATLHGVSEPVAPSASR